MVSNVTIAFSFKFHTVVNKHIIIYLPSILPLLLLLTSPNFNNWEKNLEVDNRMKFIMSLLRLLRLHLIILTTEFNLCNFLETSLENVQNFKLSNIRFYAPWLRFDMFHRCVTCAFSIAWQKSNINLSDSVSNGTSCYFSKLKI